MCVKEAFWIKKKAEDIGKAIIDVLFFFKRIIYFMYISTL